MASNQVIVAPSLIAADFSRLGLELEAITKAGASWVHFDIMDNHYVPNLTFGPLILDALVEFKKKLFFDVHLMAQPIDALINSFIEAGADLISFHPEASLHTDRSLRLIKQAGVKAGLMLNPASNLSLVENSLDLIDLLGIMSVNPGFGGQKFLDSSLTKIKQANFMLNNYYKVSQRQIYLQVDGGVNIDNSQNIINAGANVLVAGTAVFKSSNYQVAINKLCSA